MSNKVNERNSAVLEAAVALAGEKGFRRFNRTEVAVRAGVADGSVNNAFGTMDALRDAVMAAAVERELVTIVGQGLAEGHPTARDAPDSLKDAALRSLAA